MPSKSLKFYLPLWASLFLVVGGGKCADARMTITPVNGGTISPSYVDAVAPAVTGAFTFYYYVGSPLAAPSFLPSGVSVLDLTKSIATDAGLTNAIQLSVVSDVALTVNQAYAVTFFALPNTPSTPHPAPIASVNGVACSASNNQCVALNQVNPSFNHYYGVIYAGAPLKVGFYLNDICKDAQLAAGDLTGCSGGSIQAAAIGSPASIQLQISIVPVTDNNQLTIPSGTALDSMKTGVSLSFQSDSPTFTCPSQNVLGAMYFPGDTNIQFMPVDQANGNAALLKLSTVSGGQAPAQSVVVVGNDGAAPDVSSQFATLNSIHQEVPIGAVTAIGGFTNSSTAAPHPYQLSFIVRDSTGVYIPPTGGAVACTLKPVFAADIGGFLKSSNCFIATATFQDQNAIPVELFRVFRDQVLLEHPFGVAFVRWYYSWSPHGADWLQHHPIFRFSTLYFLFPLQIIALLALYPIAVGGLGLCGLLFSIVWMRSTHARKQAL